MDQAKDSEIRCVDFQSSVFHVLQQQRPQRKSPDRHGTSWKYEEMDLRWFQLAPVEQHGLALNVCFDSGLRCFPNLERHQMTTSDSPVWPRLRVCQEKILFFLCSTDEKIWIKPYRAWFKMMFLGIVVCSDNFVDHVLLKSEIKAVKFSTSVERIRCLQNASYSISGQIKVASTRLLFRSVNWSVRCIIAHYNYTNICWRYFCEHFTLFDQTWIYTWNFRLSKRCVFRILPGSYFLTFQSRARAPSQGAHRRSRGKMQLEGQWGPAWLQWLVPALSNGPMLERAWWCSPLKRAIWRRNNNHPMRLYILVVSYLLNSYAGCMHPSLPIHDIGTPNAG